MYVEAKIVTTPTRVISPMISSVMCPMESPNAATMRENSLI